MLGPVIHNGLYTIRNKTTGEWRTFRIKTQPEDAKFAPGKRILGLLTGPDNTSAYKGFAFVDDAGVHVWRRYKDDKTFKALGGMLWALQIDPKNKLHDTYKVDVSKRCLICNRTLTTPESLDSGIGPVCAGRPAKTNKDLRNPVNLLRA